MNIQNFDFAGKKVLIRVDFNVPLDEDFRITDNTRINAALPTIKKVLKGGGKAILMSHLGRPKEGFEEKFSLKHLVNELTNLLGTTVHFGEDCIGPDAVKAVLSLNDGEVLLLENLRFHPEEKKGDKDFATKLAKFGDVYINDAFGTAHRAHASTAVIADNFKDEEKGFGLLMLKEIENLDKVLKNPQNPNIAIIGGAKISGKIEVVENLLDSCDHILIGGGMAFTFLKAMGYSIGKSLVEDDKIDLALSLLEKAEAKQCKIHLPIDFVTADVFNEEANTKITEDQNIEDEWMGLDIGPKSIVVYKDLISKAKTILWNGPMGVFEMEKFQTGTVEVAKAIAKATKNGAFSLVGGGDSVAAVNQFKLQNKMSYISTGGGAMLEYMEGKNLPGIAAILSEE